jgi:hypothetical protein
MFLFGRSGSKTVKNHKAVKKSDDEEQEDHFNGVELDEEDLKQLGDEYHHVKKRSSLKEMTAAQPKHLDNEEDVDVDKVIAAAKKAAMEVNAESPLEYDGGSHDDGNFDDPELAGELEAIENEERDWDFEISQLEERAKNAGAKAVELKKMGNKEHAIAFLKEYKSLKEQVEELKAKKEQFLQSNAIDGFDGQDLVEDLQSVSFEGQEPQRDFDVELSDFEAKVKKAAAEAINFKKSGDKEKALQAMKIYKSLQQRFTEFKEEVDLLRSKSPVSELQDSSAIEENEIKNDHIDYETQKKLDIVDQRIKEYSSKAIELKKNGQLDVAKKLLQDIKTMRENRELIEFGQVDLSVIPPSIESRNDLNARKEEVKLGSSSIEEVKQIPSPVTGVQAKLQFQAILDRLGQQLEDNEKEIGILKQSAEGSLKSELEVIKRRMKELLVIRSKVSKDIDMVRAALKQSLPPPVYHIEHIEIQKELFFPEIKKGEMVVSIKNGIEMRPPDGSKRCSSYLSLELNLPSMEKQSKSSGTFEHSDNVDYNFACSFALPPVNKIGRGFKLARLELKVLCPRLFSSALLGECVFKLGDLLEKCELSSVLVLKKEGRTAGKLDISVRIRQPLKGKDIRPVQAEVVVIDHFFDNPAVSVSLDSSVESKLKSINEKRHSRGSSGGKPTDIAKQQTSFEQPLPTEALDGINMEDWKDPHNLDLFISCDVLKAELDALMNVIATSRAKKEPVEEALESRYLTVQAKVKNLEDQVQNGLLTLQAYVDMLQKSVAYHTKLIKALKSVQRIDDAKKVLARVKLMQQEIESAKNLSEDQ